MLILFFIVFRKKQKTATFRTFLLFCLSVGVWSFAYLFWQISKNEVAALFWCRALMFGAIFIPVFYLHFVLSFLGLNKISKSKIIAVYLFGFISAILVFTNLFVKNVIPWTFVPYWPKPGIYFHFFLIGWILIIIYSSYLLYRAYLREVGIKKKQILFNLIAILLGLIGGSTNYFLWYGINIEPFGNILISVYVILVCYAIIAYRLMDIKVILRNSSVYLASLILTLIPALSLKYFFDKILPVYSYWIDFVIIIFSISVFPYFKERIYRFANKYFFSSLYDSRTVIRGLSDKLGSTLQTSSIYKMIAESLGGALHMKAICFITCGPKDKDFIISYNSGFALPNVIKKNDLYNLIFKEYIAKNKIVILDELKNNATKQTKEIARALAKIGIEVLVPLNVKDKPIGAIALSAKESGDTYNNEDLDLLKIIGTQTAISLENALLYEETKKFNIKLVKEVERATHELKGANEELKKLDQAKSDFISIASHQLRTPLTVIKGYGSMMLEGSFGKIPATIEENVQKIYDSNERLIALVEDLLNISRIESGRLQFNWEVGQLEEMVGSVAEELKGNATKKGLSFKYQAPTKPLSPIKLDKTKLRQVAINLIDNAIKYTDKGGIVVSLTQEAGKLKFCVADTGMGIKEENMPSLFKKFSRGEKTSILHTEGSGLGLYVGKMMVEAHGGRIWAESPGERKGSKFCFEIPVASAVTTAKTNAQNIK